MVVWNTTGLFWVHKEEALLFWVQQEHDAEALVLVVHSAVSAFPAASFPVASAIDEGSRS